MQDLNWKSIADAGRELGVKSEAVKKWRLRRRVPYRWRLPITRKLGLPPDALDVLDAPARGRDQGNVRSLIPTATT